MFHSPEPNTCTVATYKFNSAKDARAIIMNDVDLCMQGRFAFKIQWFSIDFFFKLIYLMLRSQTFCFLLILQGSRNYSSLDVSFHFTYLKTTLLETLFTVFA